MENDLETINERGFTLVEIVIVMVMIAILVAVSVPSVTSFLRDYYFSNDMRIMVAVLNRARIRAIQTGSFTAVCFVPNDKTSVRATYMAFIDNGLNGGTANDGIRNGDEEILSTVTMHSDEILGPLKLNGGLNDGNSLGFNGMGFAMGLKEGSPVVYTGYIPASLKNPSKSDAAYQRINVLAGGVVTLEKQSTAFP
jgi:prepilin-type N-terminal cleavage/methylation domain-containing protein